MRNCLALVAPILTVVLTFGALGGYAAAQDATGPRVTDVRIHSRPVHGDTYTVGEQIYVTVWFDEEIRVTGSPGLRLALGTETRPMAFDECRACGGVVALSFTYVVQATDHDPDGVGVASNALNLNGARVTDLAGNDADLDLDPYTFENDPAHKVDGRMDPVPTVTELRIHSTPGSEETYVQGETIDLLVVFDEVVTVSGFPRLALTIGSDTRFAVLDESWARRGNGVFFEYEVQAQDYDPDGLSIAADALHLNGGSIRDGTGNDVNTSLSGHTVTDHPGQKVNGRAESRPVVTQQYWGPPPQGRDRTYVQGNEIGVHLGYNRPVVVGGSPTVALTIGSNVRHAVFRELIEGTELYFAYRVQADDYDPDGMSIGADALRLNGGSIRDPAGVDADLNLARHVVTDDPFHKVDGRVNLVPRLSSLWLTSEPRSRDTYRRDENVEVRVNFDEGLVITGSPVLALTIGTETRQARWIWYNERSGSIGFRYRVRPEDIDLDGVSIEPDALRLNGGTIRDADGNDADLAVGHLAILNDPSHKVDGGEGVWNPPPTLISLQLTSRPQSGDTYRAGEFVLAEVGFDNAVIVTGDPVLELTIGADTRRAHPFDHANPGTHLTFRYEVQPRDVDPDGLTIGPQALLLNGGSIRAPDGQDADVELGYLAIIDAPDHKVNGAFVETVAELPPVELVAGGDPAAVDLSQGFRGLELIHTVRASTHGVVDFRVSDAVLTITPLVEGATTVTVTARSFHLEAVQRFAVTVVTDTLELQVVERSLAALGRSLLASVTTTIDARFRAMPASFDLSMAGRRVPLGDGLADRDAALPGAAPAGAVADAPLAAARARLASSRTTATRLTTGELLRQSRVAWSLNAVQPEAEGRRGVHWTVWGAGDLQSFAGDVDDRTDYDGSLQAGHLGLDVAGRNWLAGVSVTRSAGSADYRFGSAAASGAGQITATLTSTQPYLRWTDGDGREVWLLAGAGAGTVRVAREHAPNSRRPSTLSIRLAAAGARQTVASAGRAEIALRGDVGAVRLATSTGSGFLDSVGLTLQRYRVGVELSHTTQWIPGARFTPFGDVGVRHDGGAGQSGSGLEVAGGVRLADAWSGFGVEARGRLLLLRTTTAYRERGVSVAALWTPGGTVDPGLSVAVTPSWGAPATGADALWREQAFPPWGGARPETGSLHARVGYSAGLAAGGTLMPFGDVVTTGDGYGSVRSGIRLTPAPHAATPFAVELSGGRTTWQNGIASYRVAAAGHVSF